MIEDSDPAALPLPLPCAEKLAFDTQRQATAAATVAAYQHGASVRPYVCRYCGLWHLASA
jgi:hypothetical protein